MSATIKVTLHYKILKFRNVKFCENGGFRQLTYVYGIWVMKAMKT
jgi:hypothetical protein